MWALCCEGTELMVVCQSLDRANFDFGEEVGVLPPWVLSAMVGRLKL